MSSNVADFRRQVMRNLKSTDGMAEIAFMDALNDAHRAIARAADFDELMVLDTANAATVANQHRYHLVNDWHLTRPKDVYSIRYMANGESRKLEYVPPRQWDLRVPDPQSPGYGKPMWYTQKGSYIELLKIPNEVANLYIYHSQWPPTLANDTDETPYANIDDVIVQLTTEITQAYLEGGTSDWTQRALMLLNAAIVEKEYKPDNCYVARPFNPYGEQRRMTEYWLDPWVKKQP